MGIEAVGGATRGQLSVTDWEGVPMLAWRGYSDEGLWYSNRVGLEGEVWAPQEQIPGVGSSVGPAIYTASYNDGLPILTALWKGIDGDDGIYTSFLDPGTTDGGGGWIPQYRIPGIGTHGQPSMAQVGAITYAAWVGAGADEGQYWMSSTNGRTWGPQQLIPNTGSAAGPSLSSFDGGLLAAWRGSGGDERIYWSGLLVGLGPTNDWTPQALLPGAGSASGPALAEQGGRVYAVWHGVDGDTTLWTSAFDGQWTPQRQLKATSAARPSICLSDGELWVAGSSPQDSSVWCARYSDLQ
jgi:hypothetical protein